MAILPTNTTVTPFIPHTDTPITLQGELTSIELLSGAVNSLQNDPVQANEFIKQLQQISPDTANRIFHLTWEHSGKPTHLGNRFGEEAFFGYWGRSIDPTVKLEILAQVLEEAAVPSAVLGISEIVLAILSYCDLQTLGRLACVNKFLNACVQAHEDQSDLIDLERLCPNLRILDAKAQGITINDEPSVNKRWILKHYNELECHVENGKGLTLLTMPQDLTLNQLIAIAAQAGISVNCWNQIVEEYGNVPVEQTYVILITNSVFQQSRRKSYAQQQELVAGHGCVMPTVQEYVALCVFTNKVFQKYSYGQNPQTYGRTSTQINGYPLAVGCSAPAHLLAPHYYACFGGEHVGVGGQRKFGH